MEWQYEQEFRIVQRFDSTGDNYLDLNSLDQLDEELTDDSSDIVKAYYSAKEACYRKSQNYHRQS